MNSSYLQYSIALSVHIKAVTNCHPICKGVRLFMGVTEKSCHTR